jgi:hypothetical protein
MFNLFKKKQLNPKLAASGDDAPRITNAFIDRMAQGAPLIGDASTLPYSKEAIRQAFYKQIENMESLRHLNPKLFIDLGYEDALSRYRALLIRIDDWYDIDMEDKDMIAKLNSEPSCPPWGVPLFAKYFGRR